MKTAAEWLQSEEAAAVNDHDPEPLESWGRFVEAVQADAIEAVAIFTDSIGCVGCVVDSDVGADIRAMKPKAHR